MAAKSKRFRIGVEGATVDGRTIEREWLTQMAKNYNPSVYAARINLEHIKGYTPDSPFRRYGGVESLEAEEIADGPLKGKMALYGYLAPTDDLVTITKAGQKVFTSMEVNPKFADTGEAYLVGLAATDDPASLGTEILSFSAASKSTSPVRFKQSPENIFTDAEAVVIEPDEEGGSKLGLFAVVKSMFASKQTTDDGRFHEVHQAVEFLATEQQKTAEQVVVLSADSQKVVELEQQLAQFSTKFDALTQKLSEEDRSKGFRQRATGGSHAPAEQTNC